VEKLNNINSELVLKALASPVEVLNNNTSGIESLVNDFPQSGLLRALLASNGNDQHVKHAAAYINPATLYKLVNVPGSLPLVSASQITFIENEPDAVTVENVFHVPAELHQPVQVAESVQYEVTTEQGTRNEIEELYHSEEVAVEPVEASVPEIELPIEAEAVAPVPETETVNADVKDQQLESAYTLDKEEFFHQDIDDDVYEEIVSIEDINLEQLTYNTNNNNSTPEIKSSIAVPQSQIPLNDHFVIDNSYLQKQSNKNLSDIIAEVPRNGATENKNLSRYNDETMPYSFMWWLDKTRKEHAQTYQPYVYNNPVADNPPSTKSGIDELQQQYVENIFNLNAIEELERSTAQKGLNFNNDRKEDRIIKRFIQTEPQIKHPAGVKLDNENKAKKSSEDRDELVTETLARIYTEQMLYQKAIVAYKKLMLKFPEKSLYFASQIEQIEKKSN